MKNKLIPLKLTQALQGFFLTAQARKLSIHTIQDYNNTLMRFKAFMERDYLMQDITAQHIESFLAEQTHLSKKTTLNYYVGLSALWTWALREKVVAEHVVQSIPAPKPEIREIVPYSEEEIRAMLGSLQLSRVHARKGQRPMTRGLLHAERNRAIILLLLDTMIRADELCSLKIHQYDRRNQRIKIFGKGAKDRYVYLSPRTQQALWRYLTTRPDATEGDPLITVEGGGRLKPRHLLKLLHTIGQRAGVSAVTVHRFRHTGAIQYLRNRGDPYTLQKLLGHTTLDMVKRYLAIAQTDIENAHRFASPVDNWAL